MRSQQLGVEVGKNVAIIGCGYVGASVARYWQERGHLVTATTTTTARVTELSKVAARVVVMDGTDALSVQSVVQNQQIVQQKSGSKRRSLRASRGLRTNLPDYCQKSGDRLEQ